MCVCVCVFAVHCICVFVCVCGYTSSTLVWYNHISADNFTHLLGTNALS